MHILGLDVGGSGIKGAIIDTEKGEMVSERHRIPTPQPATPELVVETIAKIAEHFDWKGEMGCGFPAVIKDGVVRTASNISPRWIGLSGKAMIEHATGCKVCLVNDADAAGLAEVTFGAGRGREGLTLVITLGTGIGTALFYNGQLIPNMELGHIQLGSMEAEHYASDGVRKREDLNWKEWAGRLDEYLQEMERLLWLDLIIIGGGVSKKNAKYFSYLNVCTDVVPAQLLNHAGIIGAAFAASHYHVS